MLVGRPQKRSVFRTCTAFARPSSARWAPSPRERGEGKTMPRSRMVCAVPDKFSMPSNQIRRLSRLSSEMTKKPSPTSKQKGALPEKFSLCTQLISELTKKFSPAAELKAEMTEKISPDAELKTEMTKKVSSTPNHNGACARLSGETTRLIASMANQQGAPSKKVSLQTKLFFSAPEKFSLTTLHVSSRADRTRVPGRTGAPARRRISCVPRCHLASSRLVALYVT